jgi:putative FmdB family regulatory protein
MPIYEYACHDCRRRVSLLWRSFAEAESRQPVCPRCGGARLTRVVSKVAIVRSDERRLDDLSDPSALGGLDDDSPQSLARFMRKMADESGEGFDPEFEEVVNRLEAGEDPESIDRTMPGPAGDDFGVM